LFLLESKEINSDPDRDISHRESQQSRRVRHHLCTSPTGINTARVAVPDRWWPGTGCHAGWNSENRFTL